MIIVKSPGYIYDKTAIKKLSYDFNIKQFFESEALAVAIITPYEVILVGFAIDENLHHYMISDRIVKLIGKDRFKNAVFSGWYALLHEIRFRTYHDCVTDFLKEHKEFGNVITENIKKTAKKLEEVTMLIRQENKDNKDKLVWGNDIEQTIKDSNLDVVADKDIINEDEKKICYGVPLEKFYEGLLALEKELKGNNQWQYTQ